MKKIILKDYITQDGYYLTQAYGVNPEDYIKYGLLWHEGDDFGNGNKTKEVRATHQGIVIQDWDEPKGNYGKQVVLWDDEQNIATWSVHLSDNTVSYGQRVKAGDVIGHMGSSGNVTGPHLHLNLVMTDSRGNRLYKTKEANFGFLDPCHPLDPNPPKYPPGVEPYGVVWEKPNQVTPADDWWLVNSDKWRGLIWWLQELKYQIEGSPEVTPLSKVKDVISGIRSRVTDIEGQLVTAITEKSNEVEHVSRLKGQLLESENLRKALIIQLNSVEASAGKLAGVYEGQLKTKQDQIDAAGKTIGALNHSLAQAEQKLKKCQDGGEVVGKGIVWVLELIKRIFTKKGAL